MEHIFDWLFSKRKIDLNNILTNMLDGIFGSNWYHYNKYNKTK